LQDEVFTRNKQRRFSVLKVVQGREGQVNRTIEDCSVPQPGRISSRQGTAFVDEDRSGHEIGTPPTMEDEEGVSSQAIKDYMHAVLQ